MFCTELVPSRLSLCLGDLSTEYASTKQTEEERQSDYNPFDVQVFQTYIPLYNTLSMSSQTNISNVCLNQSKYISTLSSVRMSDCKEEAASIHIKYAPLLDPVHYLIGKYSKYDKPNLPQPEIPSSIPKLDNVHNMTYVDGFFNFLSSKLLQSHNVIHGLEYYGSMLAVQDKFKFSLVDDYEYLNKSKFFRSNYNKLYEYEDPEQIECLKRFYMDNGDTQENRKRLKIDSTKNISIEIDDIIEFDDIESPIREKNDNVVDNDFEIMFDNKQNGNVDGGGIDDDSEDEDSIVSDSTEELNSDDCSSTSDNDAKSSNGESDSESDNSEEPDAYAYLYNFPVQMICMEKCDGTLDSLLESDCLSFDEQGSALTQVIFTLLMYQKTLKFTHNDLHTNNIMYKTTDIPYIEYVYKEKRYLVPTYGKIFKIIDFGRSIYTYNGTLYCSDSFAKGGDAHSQYNCEPFYNSEKPPIEPNLSFDLSRLGCSLYDFMFEDDDIYNALCEDMNRMNPVQSAVLRWCTDDRGKNILYKASTGDERYPGFKLYKMIARTVHNASPEQEMSQSLIKQYILTAKKLKKKSIVNAKRVIMDIDTLPCYA